MSPQCYLLCFLLESQEHLNGRFCGMEGAQGSEQLHFLAAPLPSTSRGDREEERPPLLQGKAFQDGSLRGSAVQSLRKMKNLACFKLTTKRKTQRELTLAQRQSSHYHWEPRGAKGPSGKRRSLHDAIVQKHMAHKNTTNPVTSMAHTACSELSLRRVARTPRQVQSIAACPTGGGLLQDRPSSSQRNRLLVDCASASDFLIADTTRTRLSCTSSARACTTCRPSSARSGSLAFRA